MVHVAKYYLEEGGKEQIMGKIELFMNNERQKWYQNGFDQGVDQGKEDVLLDMCRNPKYTDEDIAELGHISVSEVKALSEKSKRKVDRRKIFSVLNTFCIWKTQRKKH